MSYTKRVVDLCELCEGKGYLNVGQRWNDLCQKCTDCVGTGMKHKECESCGQKILKFNEACHDVHICNKQKPKKR